MFELQYEKCHQPDPLRSGYWLAVRDQACLSCHTAGAHHPDGAAEVADDVIAPSQSTQMIDRLGESTMSLNCAHCHREHLGQNHDVRHVVDDVCVRCQGDLHFESDEKPYPSIRSFVADHPNWRVLDDGQIDRRPLRMGHHDHMNPLRAEMQESLRDWVKQLRKQGVTEENIPVRHVTESDDDALLSLTCTACHQINDARRYMQPISFEAHCPHCHGLGSVDVVNESVLIPHGAGIASFIDEMAKAKALRRGHGAKRGAHGRRRGPQRRKSKKAATITFETESELTDHVNGWAQQESKKLYNRIKPNCGKCHNPKADLDRIVYPQIPDRWLTNSVFSHNAHRFLICTECHVQAGDEDQSTGPTYPRGVDDLKWTNRTKDVMLPAIDNRRSCRRSMGQGLLAANTAGSGARYDCVMCHSYHDPPLVGNEGGAFPIGEPVSPLGINDFVP